MRAIENLVELGAALASCRRPAEVALRIAEYGPQLTGLSSLLLFLKDGPKSRFRLAAGENAPDGCEAASLTPADVATLRLESEEARLLPIEALRSPTMVSSCRRAGIATVWVAPIVVEGELVRGLLVGLDRRTAPEDDVSLRVFRLMALQAAGAIGNADRHQAERRLRLKAAREASTSAALAKAAGALARAVDLDEVLEAIVQAVAEATRRERVAISFYGPGSRELVVKAGRGGALPRGTRTRLDQVAPGVRRSLHSARSVVIDHEGAEVSALSRERAAALDARLSLSVPLVLGGRVIGLLHLDQPGRRRLFSRQEIGVAEGIATQAAVAIENARLLEAERRSAQARESLNAIDEILLSTLDVGELLRRIVAQMPRAARADRCLLARPVRQSWVISHDSRGHRQADSQAVLPSGPFELVARTRQPQVVADVEPSRLPLEGVPPWHDVRAATLIPLISQDGIYAVLYLGFEDPESAVVGDLQFARRLSLVLSLALRNAQRYEGERQVAETLQESLLALPERPTGVSCSQAYHAQDPTRVGGDFYDVFAIDGDHVGVTIGDVAGKGPDAAALTSMAKHSMRAFAVEGDKGVGAILSAVNDVLFRATPLETYLTVFFGIVDVPRSNLVYASAGHTEGIVIRENEPDLALRPTGPLLGGFAGVEFGEHATPLDRDDLLFLVTDGLTEARRDRSGGGSHGREQYGMRRLAALVRELRGEPLDVVVQRVVSDVLAFSGNRLSDDMAILALRCDECPSPPPA